MAHQPAHKSGGRQRGGGVGFVVRYLKVAVFQLLKGQPVKVDSLVHGLYFCCAFDASPFVCNYRAVRTDIQRLLTSGC